MNELSLKIECAKGEFMNTMQKIQDKYALPPCIMDGVLSSVLAEVRAEFKLELLNTVSLAMQEKDKELEKAKAAAKKVIKTKAEQQDSDDEQQEETKE